ncbi:kallikrein 1-related peptidase b21-like [Microplitis demolitor]|uniref:kallikrein 1-related peptidase b21-like n=1 Tax=Microplitis demolitor TaxID=69319 RepID=UPI00235B6414|nr:kallikrein 1-related peptidase b21-like [Microplitis demolitor]
MYSKVHDHRHNVALMKLYRPFNLQHLHNSLDFSNKTSGMFVNIGATKSINSYDCCFIYGWDSILFSKMRVFTKPIQIVSVQPRDKDACVNKINDVNIVCASGESRKQCAGNPGSPIVCNEPNGNSRVLGIASWTNYSLQCDGSSTYLNLTSFRSWINNIISMDFNSNYNFDSYSSTENHKIQSKNYVVTKIIMDNHAINDFSTTLKTLERHNYENTERSDKSVEEKSTDNEELSDIFPLYNSSCANLLNSINFLVLLGLTFIFNV